MLLFNHLSTWKSHFQASYFAEILVGCPSYTFFIIFYKYFLVLFIFCLENLSRLNR